MRHEFPTEWAKFKGVKIEGNVKTSPLIFEFKQEHFPFWSQGRLGAFGSVVVFARKGKSPFSITKKANATGNQDPVDVDLHSKLTHLR